MAVKCKTCIELKKINDEIIKEFRKFVTDSMKSDELILEQLEGAITTLDCLLKERE